MNTPGRTGAAAAVADARPDDRALWRTAIALIVGALAMVFDTTIVSVALENLTTVLHASLATVQWVSTGYLLAMFVSLPITGWAQSRIGGKRLWLSSLCLFLLGSVLCTLAWNAASLIVFRVVQGLGGGVLMPLMITLIMQAAGGRGIGRIMATISLPAALGPILGPVLGGVILNLGDWRWLFLVNVPFCAVGIFLAQCFLAEDRPGPGEPRSRLDLVGLSLLTPGVAAVIYGLSRFDAGTGFAAGKVLIALIAGAVLLAGFGGWALHRRDSALVDVRLFRHRSLASASALGFLAGLTLYGAMLLLPLYWQLVHGEDPLGAALLLIPQGVGALASRNLAGRLMDSVGPRAVALAGFGTVTLATLPFGLITASTGNGWPMVFLFLRGLGMGACTIPLTGAAYVGLSRQEIPHASILTRVTQQIGGSLGTAVLAVILQHRIEGARSADALAAGFNGAFWWSATFSALAIPLCFLLPRSSASPDRPLTTSR